MSDGNGDTEPGFHHPSRRSSRPPRDVEELPEPDLGPIKTLHQYVAELHHDMRSMRSEFSGRSEGARHAIYDLGSKVDRLQAAVEGLRTCQDLAFKALRDGKRVDRWVIAGIVLAMFAFIVARSYRLVGV